MISTFTCDCMREAARWRATLQRHREHIRERQQAGSLSIKALHAVGLLSVHRLQSLHEGGSYPAVSRQTARCEFDSMLWQSSPCLLARTQAPQLP